MRTEADLPLWNRHFGACQENSMFSGIFQGVPNLPERWGCPLGARAPASNVLCFRPVLNPPNAFSWLR